MSEVCGRKGNSKGGGGRTMSYLRIRFSPALLAATLFAVGCAAPTDETDPVQVGIATGTDPSIYGGAKDDDAESMPGVVALRVGTGGTFELCTGALVAPNLVLTARHCVIKPVTTSVACDEKGRSANGPHVAADHDPGNVGVYVGGSPNFAKAPVALASAIVAPRGPTLCDADIALVVLQKPITTSKPLAVRLGSATRAGEQIRSIGYGKNDSRLPIGTRFRKTGVPILAQGQMVSKSQTPLGPHEFEVGRSICEGDSGGPAISEQTGAVIGVVSRGGNCNEDFGHIYTTTAGFSALFAEAFTLAGAQPVREAGDRDEVQVAPPKPAPEAADTAENGACAMGKTPARGGVPGIALVVAAALVAMRRRRRS